jgi:hypothetical protein
VADRNRIQAVTLDFFETLVFHREGLGRGRLLIAYLEAHGFTPLPWEHAVLYEVFEPHDAEYSPVAPQDEKDAYYVRLAGRVFSRLGIPASSATRTASPWPGLRSSCCPSPRGRKT